VAARFYAGTSGWDYPHWREVLFSGVPRRSWLRHYAARFPAVEVNATFYHLLSRASFEAWREQTPAGFRFCIKGNRFLTHNKRLKDPAASVALERERAGGLGDKLSVVLWQMPRSLKQDLGRLSEFAVALGAWPEARHALEFRDPQWFAAEVADCLAANRLAVCQSDAADWPLWDAVTTDLVYVRLHGHEATYASGYGRAALAAWGKKAAGWLDQGRDVHVYFDNDALGRAPRDALALLELVGGPIERADCVPQHRRLE
jgi:uncharacterized protein YecE (DUF72 family)